jgi:hypothetical protein
MSFVVVVMVYAAGQNWSLRYLLVWSFSVRIGVYGALEMEEYLSIHEDNLLPIVGM